MVRLCAPPCGDGGPPATPSTGAVTADAARTTAIEKLKKYGIWEESDACVSTYELERKVRIERNALFMGKLGFTREAEKKKGFAGSGSGEAGAEKDDDEKKEEDDMSMSDEKQSEQKSEKEEEGNNEEEAEEEDKEKKDKEVFEEPFENIADYEREMGFNTHLSPPQGGGTS